MTASTITQLLGWAAIVAGLVMSFLCSALETGTYVVNKIRLDLRAESGSKLARRLRRALQRPADQLGALLIGNNIANDLASSGLVLVLTSRAWPHADLYAMLLLTPVIFIFCELTPKYLFQRHGETLTYGYGWFLTLTRWAFKILGLVALVRGLVWLTLKIAGSRLGPDQSPLTATGRIATLLAEGRASGAITHHQSMLAQRVVNISRVRLKDVMVPINKAVLVSETATAEDIRQLLAARGHPRMGVYAGTPDNIIGLLSAYDVLADASGAAPALYVESPVMFPEDHGIIEALVDLRQRRSAMAFVQSQSGKCVGLVTIKDLVEEIVGELEEW